MIFQYDVKYEFSLGYRTITEVIQVAASSDSYAVQKVTEELLRRFGALHALQVQVVYDLASPVPS